MNKTTNITFAILGVLVVAFASLFGFYFQRAKQVTSKPSEIVIQAFNSSDTLIKKENYSSTSDEVYLSDLMLKYTNDFSLTNPGQYGRFVKSMYGTSPIGNQFWEITSETYCIHYPSAENPPSTTYSSHKWSLNIGISFVHLGEFEIFDFYLTSYTN